MEYYKLVKDLRIKGLVLPFQESQKILNKYKLAAEEETEIQKYEYLLVQLTFVPILDIGFDVNFTEETYQFLIEKPWEEHKDTIPFDLKVQLVHGLAHLFCYVQNYRRYLLFSENRI